MMTSEVFIRGNDIIDRLAADPLVRRVLQWRIVSPEEMADREANLCQSMRGGKRSTVQCEMDIRNHADFHSGRGARGQWFCWVKETG